MSGYRKNAKPDDEELEKSKESSKVGYFIIGAILGTFVGSAICAYEYERSKTQPPHQCADEIVKNSFWNHHCDSDQFVEVLDYNTQICRCKKK